MHLDFLASAKNSIKIFKIYKLFKLIMSMIYFQIIKIKMNKKMVTIIEKEKINLKSRILLKKNPKVKIYDPFYQNI